MHQTGRSSICNDWEFTEEWIPGFENGEGTGSPVRLPHNTGVLPIHYCDPADYSFDCGYRRIVTLGDAADKRYFLQFDGAAHRAQVYVNGALAGSHAGGYTAFRLDITALVHPGENLIAVRLDTREDPAIPPFGNVIDYLTYGGLYREVWLEERDSSFISDIFIKTPHIDQVEAELDITGGYDSVRLSLRPASGAIKHSEAAQDSADLSEGILFSHTFDCENILSPDEAAGSRRVVLSMQVPKPRTWSPEHPFLYTLTAELIKNGNIADRTIETFGFRSLRWRPDGLYLNGRRYFFRGLDRHQCWPILGYAASASLQYEDARILKEDLSCNAVRTSHYPQSQHFVSACDRLGLLVFTEIPGWQHIGDEAWQQLAKDNVAEMVLQYRNHPSVMLWGVRINESADNNALYRETNAIAHALDPTRCTSGVRYAKKSQLLEDVYAFNDFSHNGQTPGTLPPEMATPDMNKPFLISEANGHMYPTKSYDDWAHRQEHALRHARVMSGAEGTDKHAGVFQWCMFDYATHADSGAGDRICYHGVMDMYRNPKLAAAFYESQGDGRPVLEVGSSMDIGDYPAGIIGDVWIFTNVDEVRMYKGDIFVTSFLPDPASPLPHPPILIDDFIGELLVTVEGFDRKKAALIKKCLRTFAKYDTTNLPATEKTRLKSIMARFGQKYEDGLSLYGKYVANWGGSVTEWRFVGIKDGEEVITRIKAPSRLLRLCADVSAACLEEGDTYDTATIRVQIKDENDNTAVYAQYPVTFEAGPGLELLSPGTVTAEGGMCAAYVRTLPGAEGGSYVKLSCGGLEPVTAELRIRKA